MGFFVLFFNFILILTIFSNLTKKLAKGGTNVSKNKQKHTRLEVDYKHQKN